MHEPGEDSRFDFLRQSTLTGRPCGSDDFLAGIERRLGRSFAKHKPGPKPRSPEDENQMELQLE